MKRIAYYLDTDYYYLLHLPNEKFTFFRLFDSRAICNEIQK